MGLIKTVKRIIFLVAFIYLIIYFFPNYGEYLLSAKDRVTGFTSKNVVPIVKNEASVIVEHAVDFAGEKLEQKFSKPTNSSLQS